MIATLATCFPGINIVGTAHTHISKSTSRVHCLARLEDDGSQSKANVTCHIEAQMK